MLRVAIGPQLPLASWNWVGFDLARELAKYFDVAPFSQRPGTLALNPCDVVVVVKSLEAAFFRGAKVLYFPIDHYTSLSAIEQDAGLLERCSAIGCHSAALVPVFRRRCARVFAIDHHAKFALDTLAPYRHEGPILWIGAFEHVPYLLAWCQRWPLPLPLVICTNVGHVWGRQQAAALARRLGVPLRPTATTLNGHKLVPWCERGQRELLRQAKAAIDIKGGPWLGTDFWWQQVKPPTKAQQFVASGIPLAMNPDSHSAAYFQSCGLTLASPREPDRWLSRPYWDETQRCAAVLRPQWTLEAVGLQAKAQIEALVGAG